MFEPGSCRVRPFGSSTNSKCGAKRLYSSPGTARRMRFSAAAFEAAQSPVGAWRSRFLGLVLLMWLSFPVVRCHEPARVAALQRPRLETSRSGNDEPRAASKSVRHRTYAVILRLRI